MNDPILLTSQEGHALLEKLCIELGFCLPAEEQTRLLATQTGNPIAFTNAVFEAEGLEPEMADRHLYRQVQDYVVAAHRNSGVGT